MNRDPEAIWAAAMLKARRKFSNIWGMSVIVSDRIPEGSAYLVYTKPRTKVVNGYIMDVGLQFVATKLDGAIE